MSEATFLRRQREPVGALIFIATFCGFIFLCVFSMNSMAKKIVVINGMRIHYDFSLDSKCDIFLRHPFGSFPAGSTTGPELCNRYRNISADDVLDPRPGSLMWGRNPVRKEDVISLDEMPAWMGVSPIRARFSISAAAEDPDPDLNPSYLPYDTKNKIDNYLSFDRDGYEVNVSNGRRTGYRFYQFLNRCYLATEKLPRVYKYFTECTLTKTNYPDIPATVDVTTRPWINIMERNTIEKDERMPDGVEVRGTSPVKPIIYSDFPLDDNGRVTQGRAMCMADCAPGMLFKLLHKGQSIWSLHERPGAARGTYHDRSHPAR